MKLVFSRKGFDSSATAGGVPSPILPDSRMLSLPIPELWASMRYEVRYEHLWWPGQAAIGEIIEHLTSGSVSRHDRAHLDPDIFPGSLPRPEGWRPIFGQTDAAQGHLKNQRIGRGDIFLFFGLFRRVEDSVLRFASSSREQHVIFGWLQVDEVVEVDCCRESLPWASYHPHMHFGLDPRNTLYVASENLTLPLVDTGRPGAGVFDRCSKELCLAAPDAAGASDWLLPAWLAPDGQRPPLTYHSDAKRKRWGPVTREGVRLRSVARGQEFVLDCDAYPEALDWLAGLFQNAPPTRLSETP